MMWFLLFRHRLSPHHAVSPSGNLHTQYQPPPESAGHSIGKPHRWSKPAEPTTLTLTLTLTHSLSSSTYFHMHSAAFTHVFVHTIPTVHCLARLPRRDCHQSHSSLVSHVVYTTAFTCSQIACVF